MVATTSDGNNRHRFVIRPNRSLSWRQTKFCYLGIVIYSLTIAGVFAAFGMWPVLPLAGAELLALGFGMYICAWRCHQKEVVHIEPDKVHVEKGRSQPQQQWSFARAWARVHLVPPAHRLHPSRLIIRSHGREVELGAFLNESERRRLAVDLRHAMEAVSS